MAEVSTEAEALRIAEEECRARGLTWRDPVAKRGWRWWRIYSPSGQKGGSAVVYVSRRDGSTKVREYAR